MAESDSFPLDSAFLLSLAALIGGGVLACLRFVLKSRCSVIRCWGVECQRDVLSEAAVVEMDRTRREVGEVAAEVAARVV
jgi:hypothetical protein